MSSAKPITIIYVVNGNAARAVQKTVLDVPQSGQVTSLEGHQLKVAQIQACGDLAEAASFINSSLGCTVGPNRITTAKLRKLLPKDAPEDYVVLITYLQR